MFKIVNYILSLILKIAPTFRQYTLSNIILVCQNVGRSNIKSQLIKSSLFILLDKVDVKFTFKFSSTPLKYLAKLGHFVFQKVIRKSIFYLNNLNCQFIFLSQNPPSMFPFRVVGLESYPCVKTNPTC